MQWYQICDCISDIDEMSSSFRPPRQHSTDFSRYVLMKAYHARTHARTHAHTHACTHVCWRTFIGVGEGWSGSMPPCTHARTWIVSIIHAVKNLNDYLISYCNVIPRTNISSWTNYTPKTRKIHYQPNAPNKAKYSQPTTFMLLFIKPFH